MDSELPEDTNRWPHDPFQLLGLAKDCDAKTARRAYTRRIKRYKPDQFPVEFQLIHAAYERVKDRLKWNLPDDFSTPTSGLSVDVFSEPATSHEAANQESVDLESLNPQSFGQESLDQNLAKPDSSSADSADPLQPFFDLLARGEIESAERWIDVEPSIGNALPTTRLNLMRYHLSTSLSNENRGPQADVVEVVEIFSPASLPPEFSESDLQRIEWLLAALDGAVSQHLVWQRLTDEFDRQPRLAASAPVHHLMRDCQSFETLDVVVRLRWKALGHLDRQMVVDDVRSLALRSVAWGDRWQALLAESMEYTAWQSRPRTPGAENSVIEYNQKCWREISEDHQSWVADSVELLILAAEQWHAMDTRWQGFHALPTARNGLPKSHRKLWLPVAQSIAENHASAFAELNHLYHAHPLAMSVFGEGLSRLSDLETEGDADFEGGYDDEWTENRFDAIREQVACFFQDTPFAEYKRARLAMLGFCLNYQMHPSTFAAAADSFLSRQSVVSWGELVRSDGPLLCVYFACRSVAGRIS